MDSPKTISDDDAKKLGKELTKQHPATVFGMAKCSVKLKSGFKITSTKIKAVRNNGCEVFATTCRGDICEMNNAFYEFHPPLRTADDLPIRLPAIHNQVCSPSPLWLITNPLAFLILLACSALAYGVYIGNDGMADALSLYAPRLEGGISHVFGSTQVFGYFVFAAFWFSVIAHGIEASISVYYCRTALKLAFGPTCLWGILIFIVGYPIFSELQELLATLNDSHKSH
mmetsp:Transcript_21095/g.33953  ORF Transcript_21095/g.33953 Transcript_21095/m.33953 type:complete len:228 (-) Transcript_21095:154-837(-)